MWKDAVSLCGNKKTLYEDISYKASLNILFIYVGTVTQIFQAVSLLEAFVMNPRVQPS